MVSQHASFCSNVLHEFWWLPYEEDTVCLVLLWKEKQIGLPKSYLMNTLFVIHVNLCSIYSFLNVAFPLVNGIG